MAEETRVSQHTNGLTRKQIAVGAVVIAAAVGTTIYFITRNNSSISGTSSNGVTNITHLSGITTPIPAVVSANDSTDNINILDVDQTHHSVGASDDSVTIPVNNDDIDDGTGDVYVSDVADTVTVAPADQTDHDNNNQLASNVTPIPADVSIINTPTVQPVVQAPLVISQIPEKTITSQATTMTSVQSVPVVSTPIPPAARPLSLVERFEGKKVILSNYHNTNLQVTDANKFGSSPNTGEWEQWTLEPVDGTAGLFYILNFALNVRISASDDGSSIAATPNKGGWEAWTLVPVPGADGNTFYIVSAFSRQLSQSPEGTLFQSENKSDWETWRIVQLGSSVTNGVRGIISRAINYTRIFSGRERSTRPNAELVK